MLSGSLMYFASSPEENGTTAVASGLLSLTDEWVQARRACQLLAKRRWKSTVRPLYFDLALLSNAITRLKFANGRPVYFVNFTAPPPAIVASTVVGFETLMSRERGRSSPSTACSVKPTE